jgi:uncharacterized protein YjbJ (UPF0337 family)
MAWDVVEGKWKQYKGKAREQWSQLTDADVDEVAGKRDQLVGKLQERYGYAKAEAEQAVSDWLKRQEES